MINCNPETVSTDYDTSDRLYFEPLTAEDVLAVIEQEQPEGVIVQFGGQTPLRLAKTLEEAGVNLLGTPVDAIDLAEDRGRFGALLRPPRDRPPALRDRAQRRRGAGDRRAGRLPAARPPLLRARRQGDGDLLLGRGPRPPTSTSTSRRAPSTRCCSTASSRTRSRSTSTRSATAVDCRLAGVMQHVEEAGVHSGDSACVLPPMSLGEEMLARIEETTRRIALELGVIGLINIQYAVAARRALRDRGQPARLAHGARSSRRRSARRSRRSPAG